MVARENAKFNPCHFSCFESVVRFGMAFARYAQAAIKPEEDSVALAGPKLDNGCRIGMAGPFVFRQYPRGNGTTERYEQRSRSRRIRGECVS
jgi:hypothetical protein